MTWFPRIAQKLQKNRGQKNTKHKKMSTLCLSTSVGTDTATLIILPLSNIPFRPMKVTNYFNRLCFRHFVCSLFFFLSFFFFLFSFFFLLLSLKITPIDCDKNQDWTVAVDFNSEEDEIGTIVCCKTGEDAERPSETIPEGYTRTLLGTFNTGDNDRIALGDPCVFSFDTSDVNSDDKLYKMATFSNGVEGVSFSTNHCDGMFKVVCLFENQQAVQANKPTSFRVVFTQPCSDALCDALGLP